MKIYSFLGFSPGLINKSDFSSNAKPIVMSVALGILMGAGASCAAYSLGQLPLVYAATIGGSGLALTSLVSFIALRSFNQTPPRQNPLLYLPIFSQLNLREFLQYQLICHWSDSTYFHPMIIDRAKEFGFESEDPAESLEYLKMLAEGVTFCCPDELRHSTYEESLSVLNKMSVEERRTIFNPVLMQMLDYPRRVRFCLRFGADPNRELVTNEQRITILHHAVLEHAYEAIELLIQYGADPEKKAHNLGSSQFSDLPPLVFAVKANDVRAARLLIRHGANLECRRCRLLLLAAKENYHEMTQFLLEDQSINNVLSRFFDLILFDIYCLNCNIDIMRFLLKYSVDLDTPCDEVGNTFLHIAAKHQDPEAISLLLEHGANVNVANKYQETPLHIVARGEFYSDRPYRCVKILLEHGADTQAKTKSSHNPLYYANRNWLHREAKLAESYKQKTFRLLKHGLRMNSDEHLKTP